MITLQRRWDKFYISIASMLMAALSLTTLSVFSFISYFSDKSNIFLAFFCTIFAIILLYLAINLMIRIKQINFDALSIKVGKKRYNWSDVQKIHFNDNSWYNGVPFVITELFINSEKSIKIYNSYYKNYSSLSHFILSRPQNFSKALIEPDVTVVKKTETPSFHRIYNGFRFFSLYTFVALYATFLFTLITYHFIFNPPKEDPNNLLWIIPGVIFLCLLVYLPSKIIIDNDTLIIRKKFIPYTVKAFALNTLHSIQYYYPSRGPRKIMVVTTYFESHRFYIDTIPTKKLKELQRDIQCFGINVIDNISMAAIPLKANYSYRLSGKKK